MATSFGIDPYVEDGVLKGTSSGDIRKIIEGMYSNQGILNGCTVTRQSNLTYKVAEGAVVCELSEGESILMPIYATTVTVPQLTSGSRTDFIVAQQNTVAADGNNQVVIKVVHTQPSNYARQMVLAEFKAVVGKTRTLDYIEEAGFYRNYAVPSSAAGRYLFQRTEVYDGLISPKRDLPFMTGNFTLETDRLIEITVGTTVDCDAGAGIADAMWAEIWINNARRVVFTTGKIDNGYTRSECWTWNTTLEAGKHTFKIVFNEVYDTGKIRTRYTPGGFPGSWAVIKDLGVGGEFVTGV